MIMRLSVIAIRSFIRQTSFDVFFSSDSVSINNPNNPAEDYQPQEKFEYQAVRTGECLGGCT
jgi:hypothetical protein